MAKGLSKLVHHFTGGPLVLYDVYIIPEWWVENRRTLLTSMGQYADSHQPCKSCSSHGSWYTSAISKPKTNVATQVLECGIRWQVHLCAFHRAAMSTLAREAESTKKEPHKFLPGQDSTRSVWQAHTNHTRTAGRTVVQAYRWYNESKRVWFRNSVFTEAKLP